MTTEELAQSKSPLPKTAKKPELEVVKEEEAAGYQIVLTFNTKAQLEDFAAPADMNPLLVLEHLTFTANWWAHEMVEKMREKKE